MRKLAGVSCSRLYFYELAYMTRTCHSNIKASGKVHQKDMAMALCADWPPVWLLADDMDAALLAAARFASELASCSAADLPVIATNRCKTAPSSSESGCTAYD